jgi:hypothetical protein
VFLRPRHAPWFPVCCFKTLEDLKRLGSLLGPLEGSGGRAGGWAFRGNGVWDRRGAFLGWSVDGRLGVLMGRCGLVVEETGYKGTLVYIRSRAS